MVANYALKRFFAFIRYGGEWISYDSSNDAESIRDIYQILKNERSGE